MPDYNLGRAHGEVIITANTDGATQALNEYDKATQKSKRSTEEMSRVEAELSKRRQDAERAVERRKQAEKEYQRVLKDTNRTEEQLAEVEKERNETRKASIAATRSLHDAEKAYHEGVIGNTRAVHNFVVSLDRLHDGHHRTLRDVDSLIEKFEGLDRTIEAVAHTVTVTLAGAFRATGMFGAVGGAGGLIGLLGGGALNFLSIGVAGVVQAIAQLSGAVALLPAVISGAVTSLGTLIVSFHGVGDALKNINDPEKFAESLKKLSPAAQEAVKVLGSFENAFKGAMQQVQESFFAPFVNSIKPVVMTWLPQMMKGGQQVAQVFGQAAHVFSSWLLQPQAMSAFHSFITSITTAMREMLPAIKPIASAFSTLNVIGAQAFPRIAQAITKIAREFNVWVQSAAASGKLSNWINGALDGFTSLGHIIRDLGKGLANLSNVGLALGGNFLSNMERLAASFRSWTSSVEGQSAIVKFFKALHQASQALSPILNTVWGAITDLSTSLLNLGVKIGPGLNSFFKSLRESLQIIEQAFLNSGPSLNEALTELGKGILEVVKAIGPQLPGFFKTMVEVIIPLTPAIVKLANAFANLLSHLTPKEVETAAEMIIVLKAMNSAFSGMKAIHGAIEVVRGIAAAFKLASGALALFSSPIGLIIIAIAALVGAFIYAYTHIKSFHDAVNKALATAKRFGSWIKTEFVNAFHTVSHAISTAITAVKNFVTSIPSAISGIGSAIKNEFNSLVSKAYNWGRSIITRFIDGIKSMASPVTNAIGGIVGIIRDHLPSSPAKTGPLSGRGDTLMSGQELTSRLATGMVMGVPQIQSASNKIAGTAIGVINKTFEFSGASATATARGIEVTGGGEGGGGGAGGGEGGSKGSGARFGLDAMADSAIGDLEAWQKIIQDGYDLFKKIGQIFTNGIMLAATAMGKDSTLGKVVQSPGFKGLNEFFGGNLPHIGENESQKPSGPAVPQQKVPGVPNAGAVQPIPPAPAAKPGEPLPIGIEQLPSGQFQQKATPEQIQRAIIEGGRARGLTDEQIVGALSVAGAESNYGRNIYGGDQGIGGAWGVYQQGKAYGTVEDRQNPNKAINQFLDLYSAQLKAEPGLTPFQVAAGVQQHGGPGAPGSWQGTQGDNWYLNNVLAQQSRAQDILGSMPAEGFGGPLVPPNMGAFGPPKDFGTPHVGNLPPLDESLFGTSQFSPGQRVNARDLAEGIASTNRLTPNAELMNRAVSAIFGQEIKALGGTINGYRPEDQGSGEHSSGGALDILVGPLGQQSAASKALGDRINQFLQSNAKAFGIKWTIWNDQIQNAGQEPKPYSPLGAPNPTQMHEDHVHAFTGFGQDLTGTGIFTVPANVGLTSGSKPLSPGNIPPWDGHSEPPLKVPGRPDAKWDTNKKAWVDDKGNVIADVDSRGVPVPRGGPRTQFKTPQELHDEGATLPGGYPAAIPTAPAPGDWMSQAPEGWDMSQPIPKDIVRQNLSGMGLTDEELNNLPPMYYARPGPKYQYNLPPTPPGSAIPPWVNPERSGIGQLPSTYYTTEHTSSIASEGTALGMGLAQAGSLAGDYFTLFGDVIENIKSVKNITDILARGMSNSEDVVKFVDQFRSFFKTAGDAFKTGADATGLAASIASAASSAGPFGGEAAGALSAASGVLSILSASMQAVNMGIKLGEEVWHEASKYAAQFLSFTLGGPNTGPIGGNVRMLLNTMTGDLYTYSQDNPENKNVKNVRALAYNFGGPLGHQQTAVTSNLNIYAGPGQSVQDVMSDSMWLINTGGPSVVSVSGKQ